MEEDSKEESSEEEESNEEESNEKESKEKGSKEEESKQEESLELELESKDEESKEEEPKGEEPKEAEPKPAAAPKQARVGRGKRKSLASAAATENGSSPGCHPIVQFPNNSPLDASGAILPCLSSQQFAHSQISFQCSARAGRAWIRASKSQKAGLLRMGKKDLGIGGDIQAA